MPSFVSKLSITLSKSQRMSLSGIYADSISFNILWLMLAKNFLMSHFNTQQVLV